MTVGAADLAPQRHVTPLVVPLSGLGTDVAEHHVQLSTLGDGDAFPGDDIQLDHSIVGFRGEPRRHRQGIAIVVDERDDGVCVAVVQACQEAGGVRRPAHRTAPPASASSKTCGG